MLNILVVCGMGLGSSHYVLLNTIDILKKYQMKATVNNCDFFTAQETDADIYIGAGYIVSQIHRDGCKVHLEDLVDREELELKLKKVWENGHGRI